MLRYFRFVCFISYGLISYGLAAPALAQGDDTLAVDLPDVRVEAARGAGGVATAPFGVAVEERGPVARTAEAGAGIDVALRALPGAFVAGRENPALGERIVVRGLGYRSGFGVRGVQIVLDGIPLTLADGQAVLGIADPAFVRRAELVRGPASALWGNGSGGVLFLQTIPETLSFATARALGGSDGFARVDGETAATFGPHRAGLAVSHARADGYRDYSGFEQTRARAFGDLRFSAATALRLVAALEASPRLEHPGALTADELEAGRRQAEARYVDAAAGKSSTQGQLAATLRTEVGGGLLTTTAYGVARDLENPLPFAVIAVDRLAGGTRVAFEREAGPLRWTLGADAAVQRDDRTNRPNIGGEPGTERTLDQLETVTQAAVFGRLRLDAEALGLPGAAVETTLRGDRLRFDAEDRLPTDGDQSGARTLSAWSPQFGLTYRAGAALLFASFATAFETPTTTELVNRPGGGGGFNPDLEPQRTVGIEAGTRGVAGRVRYDVAAYALAVRDGLVPFEGEDGRTYYANRARSSHRGVESLAEWQPSENAAATLAYTWSRLRFGAGNEPEVEGNALPSVPEHRLAVRLHFQHAGFFIAPEVVAMSGVFVDDANTVKTDASLVVDVALGHAGIAARRAEVVPFIRINNVFDAAYVGSVVLNAQAGRYFEPAAGRTVRAGVEVRL